MTADWSGDPDGIQDGQTASGEADPETELRDCCPAASTHATEAIAEDPSAPDAEHVESIDPSSESTEADEQRSLSDATDTCQSSMTPEVRSAYETLADAIHAASPLDRIRMWREARSMAEIEFNRAGAEACSMGHTLGEIGKAAGMTRQSAHSRWGRSDRPAPGDSKDRKKKDSSQAANKTETRSSNGAEPDQTRREVVDLRFRGVSRRGITLEVGRRPSR